MVFGASGDQARGPVSRNEARVVGREADAMNRVPPSPRLLASIIAAAFSSTMNSRKFGGVEDCVVAGRVAGRVAGPVAGAAELTGRRSSPGAAGAVAACVVAGAVVTTFCKA